MKEIKNLLAENRKALQGLHAIASMDFTKPFVIIECTGNFTYNSILKKLNNDGDKINTDDYNIFVLYKRTDYSCYQDLYVARLNSSKFEVERKSIENYEAASGWRYFDTSIGKDTFEKARKSLTGHYFIVAQDKQYKYKRNTTHDNTERYRVHMRNRKHIKAATPYYYNSDEYYDNVIGYYDHRTFDKSGYVQQVNNYEQRVKALKAERSAAAAAIFDNTEKLTEFEARINKLKSAIAEAANSNSPNFTLIYHISYELSWMWDSFLNFKKNNFKSMQSVNYCIDDINHHITKAEEYLIKE